MAFITTEELATHLYREEIEVISRDDDTLLTAAIDAAIAEAYGYLGAYDRDRIFAAENAGRNALLLVFIKDMAVWHFVNLCNAGSDLELREKRYDSGAVAATGTEGRHKAGTTHRRRGRRRQARRRRRIHIWLQSKKDTTFLTK